MPEFLYRFRPVENLLGTDNRESELKGRYIYFASPSQLNDPQEGFRDIIWKGDTIVWRNLLKHFLSCLAVRNFQYFSQEDFEKFDFPIAIKYSDAPPSARARLLSAIDEFLNNTNVRQHIEILADSGRIVRRSELLLHLRSLQPYAMHVISKILAENDFIEKGFGINGASIDELLSASTAILDDIKNKNGAYDQLEKRGFTHSSLVTLMRQDFQERYDRWKVKTPDKWLRLNAGFSEEYVDHLNKLCTPAWYVACFMDGCENPAIWGSYGSNHQGVCLKFRAEGLPGKRAMTLDAPAYHPTVKKWWAVKTMDFYKVNYEIDHPDLDFFRSLAGVPAHILQSDWYTGPSGEFSICGTDVFKNLESWEKEFWEKYKNSITSKTEHWKNESEYRLVLTTNFQNEALPKDRCLRYNFNALEGIVFGIKTPAEEKFKLISIIEELRISKSIKSFNFYQAYYDPVEKKIKNMLIKTF